MSLQTRFTTPLVCTKGYFVGEPACLEFSYTEAPDSHYSQERFASARLDEKGALIFFYAPCEEDFNRVLKLVKLAPMDEIGALIKSALAKSCTFNGQIRVGA